MRLRLRDCRKTLQMLISLASIAFSTGGSAAECAFLFGMARAPWNAVVTRPDYTILMKDLPVLLPHDTQIGLTLPIELKPMHSDDPQFAGVRRLIEISSQAMSTRRGWSEDFMQDRLRIAERYSQRSWYFSPMLEAGKQPFHFPETPEAPTVKWTELHKDASAGEAQSFGTIGLTVAREGERLPMEDMKDDIDGHQWKIGEVGGRPPVLFEARAFSTADGANNFSFPNLLSPVNNQMLAELRDHPELWDQAVSYSYGDEVSLRLYPPKWKYEILEEKDGFPPIRRGKKWNEAEQRWEPLIWKAIRISPRRWFENRHRFSRSYWVRPWYADKLGRWEYPDPFRLITPNEGELWIQSLPGLRFTRGHQLSDAWIDARAEVRPGIWAERFSHLTWPEEGGLMITAIGGGVSGKEPGSDCEVAPGVWAKARTDLWIWKSGAIRKITLARPAFGAEAGQTVELDEQGQVLSVK